MNLVNFLLNETFHEGFIANTQCPAPLSHSHGSQYDSSNCGLRTKYRMAIINKSTNKCWRGCAEKGTLVHTVGGNAVGTATVDNGMEFPQKTKNGTLFCPGNSTA